MLLKSSRRDHPNVRLVVAGGNHPEMPGYVESIAERMKGNSQVEFLGYVAEEDVANYFAAPALL